MTVSFCTLDDVKRYVAVDQNSKTGDIMGSLVKDDQLLTDSIPGFSQAVDDELQWRIEPLTVVDEVYERVNSVASRVIITQDGKLVVKTAKPTIQGVSAVAYKTTWTNQWITVDPTYAIFEALTPDQWPTETSYRIRIAPGSVNWLGWRWPFQPLWIKLSYTSGYATTPPVINRATAEWIGYDYRLRVYMPTMAAGFVGMPLTTLKPAGIPPHIDQMLNAWKRRSQ